MLTWFALAAYAAFGPPDVRDGLPDPDGIPHAALRVSLLSGFPDGVGLNGQIIAKSLVVEAGLMTREDVMKQLQPGRLSGLQPVTQAIPVAERRAEASD